MIYGNGDYKYELVAGWAKIPEGESFVDVGGISIDGQDRVYVLNRSPYPIMVLDKAGNVLSRWGENHFDRAHGSCIAPDGTIYCTDDRTHLVSQFTTDGKLLATLGEKYKPSFTGYREATDLFERISSITQGGAPFNRPTGVAVSASGDIFVSDGYGNARVHRFGPDRNLIASWGEPGTDPGEFRLPHSIWVDKQDRVWIPDRENSRVQIFSSDGEYITEWKDLIRPNDVFIDDNDIVYIAELCNRVSIFTIDGKLITRWGNEQQPKDDQLFFAPHAVSVDSEGSVYVGEVSYAHAKTDRGARTIQKFARVG